MHQILPAVSAYSSDLANSVARKQSIGIDAAAELELTKRLTENANVLYRLNEGLAADLKKVPTENLAAAEYFGNIIVPQMQRLRQVADRLEKLTARSYWPYPIYSDILYY